MNRPIPQARFSRFSLLKAISVIERNRKPRPRPRSRMAGIMSSMPLSLVEPDSIHIAAMIIRIPKGTVANGGTRRACMRKAATSSAPIKNAPLGNSNSPAAVGVNASTDRANAGIRNALPNKAAPATKLTIKAKAKSPDLNRLKSSKPWPLAKTCWPSNASSAAAPITLNQRIRGSSHQSQRLPWLRT
ncbi:hypothetical protein D3C85_1203310 [compost metagenome]